MNNIKAIKRGFQIERETFTKIMEDKEIDPSSALISLITFYRALSVRLSDVYGLEAIVETVEEAYMQNKTEEPNVTDEY